MAADHIIRAVETHGVMVSGQLCDVRVTEIRGNVLTCATSGPSARRSRMMENGEETTCRDVALGVLCRRIGSAIMAMSAPPCRTTGSRPGAGSAGSSRMRL
jgi:hypothetical protein